MVAYRLSWLALLLSVLIALILEVVSLPATVSFLRPEWLVLTLVYWLLRHPEAIGIASGVIAGVFMDVLSGTYFGIHVLSLSLICYLVLIMHQRLKMFPVAQQAVVLFFITGIHLMVVYTMRSLLSYADSGLDYLWQALASALLWPFIVIFYDRLVYALR